MTDTVVDSSVIAKWVLPELDSSQAQKVISDVSPADRLIILDLAFSEVANAIWKRQFRSLITDGEAKKLLGELLACPVHVVPAQGLLPAAIDLACKYRRPVYDSLFLALSIDLGLRHCGRTVVSRRPRQPAADRSVAKLVAVAAYP